MTMNYKFDGDRLFFTSDTHFNHTNILQYCNRPFKTVDQMNETIITNWNNVVEPDDVGSVSLSVSEASSLKPVDLR